MPTEMLSVSNISLTFGREASFGTEKVSVSAGDGKLMAFDSEKFSSNQTLEKNREISGTRMQQSLVPGDKNPGGALSHKATINTVAWWWEFILGSRVTTGAGPYEHVSDVANSLPSFVAYRKEPYAAATKFYAYRGGRVGTWSVKVTATGYYIFQLGNEFYTVAGPLASNYDASPTDWTGGSKLHHALLAAADVKVDGAAFGNFLDLEISGNNQLDTTDHPVGAGGDRGGLVPDDLEVMFKGTLRNVTLAQRQLIADYSVVTPADHTASFKWTIDANNWHKLDLAAVQFDPTDATADARGTFKLPFTGHGHIAAGKVLTATTSNAISGAIYDA